MKMIVAKFAMVIGSVWIAYSFLPNLITDSRTNDWVPALELEVEQAKCTVHWHLLSTCEVKYHDRERPSETARSIDHLVYGSWGDEQFLLLRSASHPEIVTTTLGIRDLTARMVTMGLWFAIMLYMGFAIVRSFFRQNGTIGATASVPVQTRRAVVDVPRASVATRTEFGRRSRGA